MICMVCLYNALVIRDHIISLWIMAFLIHSPNEPGGVSNLFIYNSFLVLHSSNCTHKWQCIRSTATHVAVPSPGILCMMWEQELSFDSSDDTTSPKNGCAYTCYYIVYAQLLSPTPNINALVNAHHRWWSQTVTCSYIQWHRLRFVDDLLTWVIKAIVSLSFVDS